MRLLVLLCFLFAFSPGQSPASASDAKTAELVREAVAALTEQSQATHRFTYFELAHTQNRNEKGKLYYDRAVLTEMTYIADLPFERMVEVDGKPLAGRQLAEELARYDQAMRDRSALDAAARAKLDRQLFVNAAIPYAQLTSRFRLTRLRSETIAGQAAEVIDAAPIPSSDPALPTESRHIQLWVARATSSSAPLLLRAEFEYVTPDQTSQGQIQPGSHGRVVFTGIDGVAVPDRKEVHTRIAPTGSSKPIQVDVERTYSRYRQFTSSTRILPAEASAPPR